MASQAKTTHYIPIRGPDGSTPRILFSRSRLRANADLGFTVHFASNESKTLTDALARMDSVIIARAHSLMNDTREAPPTQPPSPASSDDHDDPAPFCSRREPDDEPDVNEEGLDAEEIRVVQVQTGTTRARAVEALRQWENVVDAILALTP